jgi:hypothetical protein
MGGVGDVLQCSDEAGGDRHLMAKDIIAQNYLSERKEDACNKC